MKEPMSETDAFTLRVIQEDAWPLDATEIQALLEVTARPGAEASGLPAADGLLAAGSLPAAGAAEVIIMDCSGSMVNPPGKLRAAKRAVHAALDAMHDGTRFAIVAGTRSAKVVYPREQSLERATPSTREAAKGAVGRLDATDGTMISSWLDMARQLLEPYPGHVRHAMLFTDGKNKHESRDGTLDRVLASCRGTFTCDARGIGDGWEPSDLLRIVGELHGTADGLPDVAGLEEDFRAVMRAAMGKVVPDVALRIRTGTIAVLRQVLQTYPAFVDLTGHGEPADATATDYWIGSWGGEIRHYRIMLAVDSSAAALGKNVRLARAEIVLRDRAEPVTEPGFIVASWTDEPRVPTWRPTDSYLRQHQAGDAITIGCHAWYRDDLAGAAQAWGKAARLASAANDTERLKVLESLVHILDPAAGQVRLRDDISRAAVLKAEARSTTSTFVPTELPDLASAPLAKPRAPDGPVVRTRAALTCPACGRISPPGALFCERCGQALGAAGGGQRAER